jgi:CheY-like chemotaxis protein
MKVERARMASSILVLEDDENLRETIIELLEDHDYHVVGADGPDKAIEIAKKQVFHLMISDIRMAGSTDGIGAVSKIKRDIRPEIFVLMITGYADTEAPFRAMDAQVDGYLYKNDFNANLLLMTVESILKQREEKSFFRSLLNPLMNASKKLLHAHEQAKYERAKEKLDEGRYAAYKRYVVSIQSRQLLIGGALEIWDSFDIIEGYYPKVHTPPEMGQIYAKYAEIYKMIDERCRKPLSQLKPREPKQVDRKTFQGLFDRISNNRLSATDVQMAEHLRKMDPGERNRDPNFRRLYNRIWLGQV